MINNSLVKIKENAISELVRNSISSNEACIEVEMLLEYVFQVTKRDLILYPDKILSDDKIIEFNNLIQKRINENLPVQYLTNRAYFMGQEFYVNQNVLIPRPETELLVEEIIKIAKKINASKILDIGTGSGCIACMLANNLDNTEITASDISDKALEIASLNAKKLAVNNKIKFVESDLFSNISEKFDIIVSNPPYIPISQKNSLQSEVVSHEPHLALFAEDSNGIFFYEQIIKQSKTRLSDNGYIAFEIGIDQASFISDILNNEAYQEIEIIRDYCNIERIITARFTR